MIETMLLAILIGAGLVVISILTSLVSFRVGAPLLLVFLLVGLVAGEQGFGIPFDNAEAAYFIGSLALAVILFDSGAGTRLETFRLAAAPAVVLSTVGVLLTAALVAVPVHHLLGFNWPEALLMGAIVGSTDAAAVFFLLRVGGIRIREKVRATLEVESGSNDPMAIFLTLALVELIASGASLDSLTVGLLEAFLRQMGLGLLLGVVGGWLLVQIVNRLRLEAGLYPIITIGLALIVFAVTSMAGGSGFLAVYAAGLIVGNSRLRGGLMLRRFQDGLTWLAQITMFLVLGLLASPQQFPSLALEAIAIALALTFFARPLAVWLCLLPFRFRRNDTTFVAWVGLRGAVSILLGILPVVGGLEQGQNMFNLAFLIVLVSLVVQGWTIRPMARWLGLIVPPRIGPLEKIELELPGGAHHELIAYRVVPDCPVAKGERIPRWARPSLVLRDGRSMRLHEAGRLQPGDTVYIFAAPRLIGLLDRLFARPAALSSEDHEYFGHFSLEPDGRIGDAARLYDFDIAADEADLSVADFLRKRLGAFTGRGERLAVSPVELIVREMDEEGRICDVGLALTPGRASTPRLPLFQSSEEIVAGLRAWWRRRRQAAADPVAGPTAAAVEAPAPPSGAAAPPTAGKKPGKAPP